MKQFMPIAILIIAVTSISALAGVGRANELAANTTAAPSADSTSPVTEALLPDSLQDIAAEDLQILIDTNPAAVIIDARRAEDFAQGHIPGAVRLSPADVTAEALQQLTADKTAPLVFYCGNPQCPAAGKSAYKAAELGYQTLFRYAGGIEDWRSRGLPLVSE